MTTEKTDQKQKAEECGPSMDCCTPQKMMEMMSNCGEGMNCDCSSMMQEMMKGGSCQPEQK